MLSLIGSALGLFSSAIPKVMDMWQDKNDKAHELSLLKAQAEITLDQTAIDASIREVESIHEHDSNIKGSTWVENTRALVRPIYNGPTIRIYNFQFQSITGKADL